MVLSILFSENDKKIKMDSITKNRGNREIFKISIVESIPRSGIIYIYEKNKEVANINYSIGSNNTDIRWYQLNQPSDNYVVQIRGHIDSDLFIIEKIAIQKIIGEKNILLNI